MSLAIVVAIVSRNTECREMSLLFERTIIGARWTHNLFSDGVFLRAVGKIVQ